MSFLRLADEADDLRHLFLSAGLGLRSETSASSSNSSTARSMSPAYIAAGRSDPTMDANIRLSRAVSPPQTTRCGLAT